MSFFTFSGNKLAATVLAAGALAVSGTGVAAMAESLPQSPAVLAETESPSPSPTETETQSPEPEPTETETETPEPEPTETETETPEPEPTETDADEPAPASVPVGPDATGPAAFGLCNAYSKGGLNSTSTAYAALVQAAGDGNIDAYCATIPVPPAEDDGETGEPVEGGPGEELVEPQQVAPQNQGAPAAVGAQGAGHQGNGHQGAGHQSNGHQGNGQQSNAKSGRGQR